MSKLAYLRRWKSVDKLFELSISGLNSLSQKVQRAFSLCEYERKRRNNKISHFCGKTLACSRPFRRRIQIAGAECYFGVALRASKGRGGISHQFVIAAFRPRVSAGSRGVDNSARGIFETQKKCALHDEQDKFSLTPPQRRHAIRSSPPD